MSQRTLLAATIGAATASLAAQQQLVVPNTYQTADAPAYGWIAGASRPLRQQTLIGSSHLAPLIGQTLTALDFRRHAAAETYQGGAAQLTINLSIAPVTPLTCSNTFGANSGATPTQVFSGQVSFPTSPQPAGSTATWSTADTIHIQLTSPFVYSGGTLCVDIVGQPIAGQNADWWMADLDLEDIAGTTTNLGGGCGLYGGVNSEWSFVPRRTLLPGSNARFFASGTPGGLALAAFGTSNVNSIPLAATGLPAASGCDLWLGTIEAILPTVFIPPTDPSQLSFGGDAEVSFRIPNSPTVFGLSLTTQWIDWTQMATSNAITWTVASSTPSIDMALIEGDPTEANGLAAPYMGHVIRFEYQ